MSGRDNARGLVARALGLAAGDVPADARLDDWEKWDSFSHEQILTELEKTLERKLAPAEIVRIECLADIDAMLKG